MFKKIFLALLVVVGGCCDAEPTREEQEAVEAEYLQHLVDSKLIDARLMREADGSQVVLEAVEEILPVLAMKNSADTMLSVNLAAWKVMIDIARMKLGAMECLPQKIGGIDTEYALSEWVKTEYMVPLEAVVRDQGFVEAFDVLSYFYRCLVLVYPFEFDTDSPNAAYAHLRAYITFVGSYKEKNTSCLRGGRKSCRPSPFGSSPVLGVGRMPFFDDVVDVGLVLPGLRAHKSRGVKGKRDEERSYFRGPGAGSPSGEKHSA